MYVQIRYFNNFSQPNVTELGTVSCHALVTWIILQSLCLHTANHQYGLRNRRHNYILNIKRVTDERNFITRMLFIEYMY